jgi:CHAD domain-containing protein
MALFHHGRGRYHRIRMSEGSPSLALTLAESPADGIRRVSVAALDDAMGRLEQSPMSDTGVHEVRKRIKELRAIARLVSTSLPRNGKPLRLALRDIGRQLGASRDADALIESFDKLRKRFAEPWGKRRFGKIRMGLVTRKAGLAVPDPRDAGAALRALRPLIEAWDPGDAGFDLIADGLLAGYQRPRRAMRASFAARTPRKFHEWRKRVKDHWYHVQIVEAAWPPVLGAQAKALHDLSRLLGDHHDLVMLQATLREDPRRFASARLLRLFDGFAVERLSELEDEAGRLGRRLFVDKPPSWLRRIRRFWNVWRRDRHDPPP